MAVLRVVRGSVPGQVVQVKGEKTVLGRHPSCQVVLDNASVSRTHAQITESHGAYVIEDLHSRNGTFVNGQKIRERIELSDGDEIKVCDVVMTFHMSLPVASPVDPSKPGGASTAAADTGRLPAARPAAALLATYSGEMISPSASSADVLIEDNSSILSSLDMLPSALSPRIDVKPEIKLRAVMEISRSLVGSLDLGETLPKIIRGLFNIFPYADRGCVVLKNDDTSQVSIRTMLTRREEQELSGRVSMTIIRQAMSGRRAILSADAVDDQRFEVSESLPNLRLRSVICAPLVGAEGRVHGVIQLDTLDIRQQFTQDDLEVLASVASLATLSVENALLHETALKQRDMERELDFASQVQQGFLPTERPRLAGYEFYEYYEAARGVGGDFYDYVPLPGGRVAIGLGDVAGKGVSAALLMARMYSAARFELLTKPVPSDAMTGLNQQLVSGGMGHRFVTMVIVVVDPATHTLTLVNAGHLLPLLRRAGGTVEKIDYDGAGLPLGIKADTVYRQLEVPLEPGDTLVLYTDGVTEAANAANDMYGTARIVEFLTRQGTDVETLGDGLVANVEAFCQGESQRDDICLVCFRRVN
jgi:serine phosphatase RsbU (regulator of sigma subunit)